MFGKGGDLSLGRLDACLCNLMFELGTHLVPVMIYLLDSLLKIEMVLLLCICFHHKQYLWGLANLLTYLVILHIAVSLSHLMGLTEVLFLMGKRWQTCK